MTPSFDRLCALCRAPPPTAPQLCNRCYATSYCSRVCQVRHWPLHSATTCVREAFRARLLISPTLYVDTPAVPGLYPTGCGCHAYTAAAAPFARLASGTFLHGHPNHTTYQLLVDCFRLWTSDMLVYAGVAVAGTMEAGRADSGVGFARWIGGVCVRRCDLLPPWWSWLDNEACGRFGLIQGADTFHLLSKRVSEVMLVDHYADALMAMKLRILGQQCLRQKDESGGRHMGSIAACLENTG